MVNLVSGSMAGSSTAPSSTSPTRLGSPRANSHVLGLIATVTVKPVAVNVNQIQNSQTGSVKPVAWDSVIETDLDSPQEHEPSVESIPFKERVYARLRIMMNRHLGDRMDDLDKNSLIWEMFMSSTMNAAVFLVKGYL